MTFPTASLAVFSKLVFIDATVDGIIAGTIVTLLFWILDCDFRL